MSVINKFMNFLGLQEEEEYEESITAEEPVRQTAAPVKERRSAKGNVVSIHSQKNVRFVLSEPRSYEETQDIADHLRSRRPVIVNLQRVRNDQAVRIIDFLSGTVYALNGGISKVGPEIFLCTPENIEVEGSITEILKEEMNS